MDLQSVLDRIEKVGHKRSLMMADVQALKASITDLYRKSQTKTETVVRGIISHNYVNASDDLAQWDADRIGRQEVTPEWFAQYGVELDLPFLLWVRGWSDESLKSHLTPWIIGNDFGYQYKPGYRVFVQKQDLVRHGFMENVQPESANIPTTNAVSLLQELVESLDAIDAEAARTEANGGKGWSAAPVIRSHYARSAAKKFLETYNKEK